jgi:hypothetical protein
MGQVIEFSDWQAIGKAATTVVEDSRRRSWARAREEGALRPEARRMADAIRLLERRVGSSGKRT